MLREPGRVCAAYEELERLTYGLLPAMQTDFSIRPSSVRDVPEETSAVSHHGAPTEVQRGLKAPPARPLTRPLAESRGRTEGPGLPQGPGRAGPGGAGPAAVGQQGGAGASGPGAKPELSQGCLRQRSLSALPGAGSPRRSCRGFNAIARLPSPLCHPPCPCPCPKPALIPLLPRVSCRPRRVTAKQEF